MLGKKLRQKEGMLGEMTLDQLVLVQLALELAGFCCRFETGFAGA